MNFERCSDEQLLEMRSPAEAGGSFAAFYGRHHRLVMAFHFRAVRDADLAAELTAETFVQALSSRARFGSRGEGSALRWLYTLASNVRANSARRAGREQLRYRELGIVIPVIQADVAEELAAASTDDGILRLLEQLPAKQRDAVRAFVLGEQTYDEIAAQDGASATTVRKRVSRGLMNLRRSMEETP